MKHIPTSAVLHEKLIFCYLVKKFPSFYEPTGLSCWSFFWHHSAPSHWISFHTPSTSTPYAFIFCSTRAKFLASPTSLQFIIPMTFDERYIPWDPHCVILSSHLLASFLSIPSVLFSIPVSDTLSPCCNFNVLDHAIKYVHIFTEVERQ